MKRVSLIIVLIIFSGCGSIEGTRNKSLTISSLAINQNIESLAILPVKENAVMPGLSNQIEKELYSCLCAKLPNARVIDARIFGFRLATNDLISDFGKWKAGYEASSVLDVRPLLSFSRATDARYFLLVRSTHLSREKIRAVDTGYSGWVSDAKNVWRTDLKVSAELIDAESGRVVWEGFGSAENINSPRKDIDLGLVIVHQINPEVKSFAPEMVRVAAEGIATQIATITVSLKSSQAKEERPTGYRTPEKGLRQEESTGYAPTE
jgi:hypothetical protein